MDIKVPSIDDKHLPLLLEKLNATHEPIYLPVTPEPGAQIKDCFMIVQEKVRKNGGRMVMGWQIWDFGHMIEAECHAVWEDVIEDGQPRKNHWHDLTPKEIPFDEILFVGDSNLVYNDKQIDSVRLNTSDNPLVDDLIAVSVAIHRFQNKGERATLYDNDFIKSLSPEQIVHYQKLSSLRDIISMMIYMNERRDSLCPCGSGKIFIACHGKGLSEIVKKDV